LKCTATVLQELAKERFDATKFLSVFKRGHPEWLVELIADRRGRQLIYELSAAHRNSLLLNYAIQRILKQVRLLHALQQNSSTLQIF
jgi:hypothetical protein